MGVIEGPNSPSLPPDGAGRTRSPKLPKRSVSTPMLPMLTGHQRRTSSKYSRFSSPYRPKKGGR